MNWISTGEFVWCVDVQTIHKDAPWWKEACKGPHRPVAVLLHSLDEYVPKERAVTMEIEGQKPVPLEQTTKPGTGDLQYVQTSVPLDERKFYCHLYEHVQAVSSCAIDGYQHLPVDHTHGYHQAAAFKMGKRSPYVKYTQLVEQVAEELAKPENSELLEQAKEDEVWRCTNPDHIKGKHACAARKWKISELKNFRAGDHKWSNGGGGRINPSDGLVTTSEYLAQRSAAQAQEVANAKRQQVGAESLAYRQREAQKNGSKPEVDPQPVVVPQSAGIVGETNIKELEVGDWVLVRAQVRALPKTPYQAVRLQILGGGGYEAVYVRRDEIASWIEPPAPLPPHKNNVLISEKTGEVFVTRGSAWVSANGAKDNQQYQWPELWSKWGPFREYYASRLLKADQ